MGVFAKQIGRRDENDLERLLGGYQRASGGSMQEILTKLLKRQMDQNSTDTAKGQLNSLTSDIILDFGLKKRKELRK